MGAALSAAFPEARETLREADEALGFSLSELCFAGPEAELNLTINTQPAVLAVSIAAARVLSARGWRPNFVAGHSLGEYGALVTAGVLRFSDAVRTVRRRGDYMQEAVPPGVGAMAAILRASGEVVAEVCAQSAGDHVCAPANFNAPEQTVIAGHREAVARAVAALKERRARAVDLPVSAPFHCSLMAPAERKLEADLAALPFSDPHIPVVANVDAEIIADADRARRNLVAQVCAPVRWVDCMRTLIRQGVSVFVEVGPKTVLSGLAKQIAPDAVIFNVESPETLARTEAELERLAR
jgi:[acyl-carrier-protein] S-malonyltransferase